ncbi:MAG: methyltransferase domain-containing protein [Anaerolineae bacterium]|nr:methyltransferase domain-containing protein [Anaerolineae bacterium]
MNTIGWIGLIITIIAAVAALGIYHLVITEGAYLGQWMVTWLYDITAHEYDSIKQFSPEAEQVFLGEPLSAILSTQSTALVLDVATGTARLPITLFEQPVFQGRIVGLDDSRRMLTFASEKVEPYRDRINLIWRNAISLPFPDGVFDAVCCLEMLEFTPDPEAQLAETIRVLRPGGCLITTRRRGWNAAAMPGKTHSKEAFEALLTELGIVNINILSWQVEYDLVWGIREGYAEPAASHLEEVLACPACESIGWDKSPKELICDACGAIYAVSDGIIDMHRVKTR